MDEAGAGAAPAADGEGGRHGGASGEAQGAAGDAVPAARVSVALAGVVIRTPTADDRGWEGDAGEAAGAGDAAADDHGDEIEGGGPGRDWAWVEEWRESDEPPAWAPGVTVAVFTAILVCLAVLVLSTGLADVPWLAVSANVLVAAGLAPALWLSRHLPVLRFVAAGAALGMVIGWIGALIA